MPGEPSERERDLLELDEGEAAFTLQRLGQNGDEVVEWRVTVIRGDRFHFVADWSAGEMSGLRLQPTTEIG